jgi:hypothetical protein
MAAPMRWPAVAAAHDPIPSCRDDPATQRQLSPHRPQPLGLTLHFGCSQRRRSG